MVLKKPLSLQRVFHSIRFKVNKGWTTAVVLFLCLYAYRDYFFTRKPEIFNQNICQPVCRLTNHQTQYLVAAFPHVPS